jgi:hypothetical protein
MIALLFGKRECEIKMERERKPDAMCKRSPVSLRHMVGLSARRSASF